MNEQDWISHLIALARSPFRSRCSKIGELVGTIRSSSRGPQEPAEMVDNLAELGISIIFAIGGDDTLKGTGAIAAETGWRQVPGRRSIPRGGSGEVCWLPLASRGQ